ncbi:hypothetical protein [Clostridium sp. E02]|uniref:hypothetical protein n=1 Tax=Clostridium sp. E02 TaxID=2487134 RepID=UPI000F546129|nr:hypothetical protein [Clostridium sp. E02]
MTEQELLDMFIQERINMLLDIFNKNQPDKSKKEMSKFYRQKFLLNIYPAKRRNWLNITLILSQIYLHQKKIFCINMDLWMGLNC